ncbi:hypothetical protein T10_12321 [Trichinella papuae]|uniref:Uncharacterized protein n=1 Tax=Trichinella papuae TaxID=268474 RepID=A0A0V1MQN6_9BILA|nr:hypothetical protein T10_12321 [Trichinella papuae]
MQVSIDPSVYNNNSNFELLILFNLRKLPKRCSVLQPTSFHASQTEYITFSPECINQLSQSLV